MEGGGIWTSFVCDNICYWGWSHWTRKWYPVSFSILFDISMPNMCQFMTWSWFIYYHVVSPSSWKLWLSWCCYIQWSGSVQKNNWGKLWEIFETFTSNMDAYVLLFPNWLKLSFIIQHLTQSKWLLVQPASPLFHLDVPTISRTFQYLQVSKPWNEINERQNLKWYRDLKRATDVIVVSLKYKFQLLPFYV